MQNGSRPHSPLCGLRSGLRRKTCQFPAFRRLFADEPLRGCVVWQIHRLDRGVALCLLVA